jgi:hypothetical protein
VQRNNLSFAVCPSRFSAHLIKEGAYTPNTAKLISDLRLFPIVFNEAEAEYCVFLLQILLSRAINML